MSGSNLWRFREFIFSVGIIMSNSLSLLFCQRNSLYTYCVLQVCRIHTKSRTTTANIFIINMDNTYNYVPLSTEPLVLCEKLFLAWKRHHNQWRFSTLKGWKVDVVFYYCACANFSVEDGSVSTCYIVGCYSRLVSHASDLPGAARVCIRPKSLYKCSLSIESSGDSWYFIGYTYMQRLQSDSQSLPILRSLQYPTVPDMYSWELVAKALQVCQ